MSTTPALATSKDDLVLQAAQSLWREGHREQARNLVSQAMEGGVRRPRLLAAAHAYDDVFVRPIAGHRLSLVRRSPADLAMVRRAWQDSAFMERFHRMAPALPADDKTLTELLARESQATLLDTRNLHWTIVTHTGIRAGMVSMVEISLRHARAEFIVGVLDGTPGLALEASLLALEFAFQAMRLHKVCSSIYGQNDYALRSTLHLGFRHEGTLHDHLRDAATGQFVAMHLSGLFKDDFLCASNQRLALRLLKRPLAA